MQIDYAKCVRWLVPRKVTIFAFMRMFVFYTLDDASLGVFILLRGGYVCSWIFSLVCVAVWSFCISLWMSELVMLTLRMVSSIEYSLLYAPLIIYHFAQHALTYCTTVSLL